ncbi:unnamed protein product [Closterium sp. NIES-53]
MSVWPFALVSCPWSTPPHFPLSCCAHKPPHPSPYHPGDGVQAGVQVDVCVWILPARGRGGYLNALQTLASLSLFPTALVSLPSPGAGVQASAQVDVRLWLLPTGGGGSSLSTCRARRTRHCVPHQTVFTRLLHRFYPWWSRAGGGVSQSPQVDICLWLLPAGGRGRHVIHLHPLAPSAPPCSICTPLLHLSFPRQVVECRRVLKWTYAYGYYLPEAEVARRQFFEYLQGEADTALENLHKMAEKELELYICDDGDPPPTSFNDFRSRLAGLTSGGGADHKMAEKELELYFCDDGDPPPTSFNDFRSLLAGLTSSRRDDGRDGEAAQSDLCHAFLPLTPLHGIYCLAGGTRRGPHSLLPPTLPTFHPPFRPPPTSVTHTYFENLVRALENGLADVENASTAASSTRAAAAAAAAAAGRAIASTSRISQSRFGARTRSRTTAASAATASTSAAGSSAAGPSGSSAGAAAVGGGSGAGSSRGSIFRSSSSQAAAAAAAAAVTVGNTGGRDREETAYWSCEHCTYANPLPGRACAMCHLPRSTQ